MENELLDLIVIGAGPAGLTASIYASRYELENIVIGKEVGGRAADAAEICNYPSRENVSGAELTEKIRTQVQELGGEIVTDEVVEVVGERPNFLVKTEGGNSYRGKTIILATGLKSRDLGLPEEEKFLGRGVSYCFTCDGPFFKDKTVAVVGGSDAANTASLFLSKIADKVYQIYRRSQLRGMPAWREQIKDNPKIEVIYNTNVVGLRGDQKLERVVLDRPYQGDRELSVQGLFIEIGATPVSLLAEDLGVERTEKGYIKTRADQLTNVDGVWAAGDITTNSNGLRQIVTACAEGAVAARAIFDYLRDKE